MLTSTKTAAEAVLNTDPTLSPDERKTILAALDRITRGQPPDPPPPRILTRGQVAERVNRSPRCLDMWCRAGLIKKVRFPGQSRAVGFLATDVDALLCGKVGQMA